jgi:hypothetical protein
LEYCAIYLCGGQKTWHHIVRAVRVVVYRPAKHEMMTRMITLAAGVLLSASAAAAAQAGGGQAKAEAIKAHHVEHGAPAHPLHADRET